MPKTPEEVLQTAYEDGCQIALDKGFTRVGEVTSPFEVPISRDLPPPYYSWLTQIDRASIFIDGRDIVGLVLGRENWKPYSEKPPTPCLRYAAVPILPSTETSLVLVENLPRLVDKQSLLENAYGRWFEVSVHPLKHELSFNGSSAADIMGLTRGNRDWLFEDPGREALKVIIEDSFDLLARHHRLIGLLPQTSPV